MISRLRAVLRLGCFCSPGSSFAVGGSPNPSQAIGAPAVCVAQPVPETQQPERAVPAMRRTRSFVCIAAPGDAVKIARFNKVQALKPEALTVMRQESAGRRL